MKSRKLLALLTAGIIIISNIASPLYATPADEDGNAIDKAIMHALENGVLPEDIDSVEVSKKTLDEILAASTSAQEVKEKLAEAEAAGTFSYRFGFSNINDTIDRFYMDPVTQKGCTSLNQLLTRANIVGNYTYWYTDPNIPTANAPTPSNNQGLSAEGGYLADATNDKLTNKEKEYRSNTDIQTEFKKNYDAVSQSVTRYFSSYKEKYNKIETATGLSNATITEHKIVLSPNAKGNADKAVSPAGKELELLADIVKLDLSGLESLALASSVINFGADADKTVMSEKHEALLTQLSDYYGDSPLYDYASSGPVSVIDIVNPETSFDYLYKFKYQESLALVEWQISQNDTTGLLANFNTSASSISEFMYSRMISNQYDANNVNKLELTVPQMPTDASVQTQIDATKDAYNKGLESVNTIFNKKLYDDALCRDNFQEAGNFGSPLAYLLVDRAKGNIDTTELNSMPIITNGYNEYSDKQGNDNKFLLIELALANAINSQRILSVCGLTADTYKEKIEAATNDEIIAEFKAFLNDNKSGYIEVVKTARALANFYRLMGYNTKAKTLEDYIDTQIINFNNFLTGAGIAVIDAKDVNIGSNILPEKVSDQDSQTPDEEQAGLTELDALKDMPEFYELIAWTGCFTPFQTNVNNIKSNATHLSPSAAKIYEERIGKLSPLYAVEGDKGTYTALAERNIRQLNYITLRDFINRFPTEDIALFASALTAGDVVMEKTDTIVMQDAEGNTTLPEKNTSNTTNNPDKFIGPVYLSSGDTQYGTKATLEKLTKAAQKSADADVKISIDEKLDGENADGSGNQVTYDIGTERSGSVRVAHLTSQLSPQQIFTNYVLMYNTLKDENYKTSALDVDMDRPLYIDFIGNIVTETGYVVVPAAANTTFYTCFDETGFKDYPIYTAMFMNSYPKVYIESDGNIELKGRDVGKFVFALTEDSTKSDSYVDTPGYDTEEDTQTGADAGLSNKKWKFMFMKTGEGDKSGTVSNKLYVHEPQDQFVLDFQDKSNSLSMVPYSGTEAEEFQIDIIDTNNSFLDTGVTYLKGNKSMVAKVFTPIYQNEITIDIDGIGTSVTLNGTSAIPEDASWKATLQILKNHYLNANNQTSGDYANSIIKTTDYLIPIAKVVDKCSLNPREMLIDNSFINYEEKLKDDKITSSLGSLLESFINKIYGMFNQNLMLYTPTIGNMSFLASAYMYLKPVGLMGLVIFIIVIIVGMLLRNLGRSDISLIEMFLSSFIVLGIFMYSLFGHPIVTRFIFEYLPSLTLGDDVYDFIIYETESEYKTNKTRFFTSINDTEKDTSGAIIKVKTLDEDEVQSLRKHYADVRPEVTSIFYSPRYDNNVMYVVGTNIYLKGNCLYISVADLFDNSSVVDMANVDNTFSLNHELYDDASSISFFTPYYNILESMTYTINTFSEGCDAQVQIKNYSNMIKTTGRATSYFNSIFFISPENVDSIKNAYTEQRLSNIYEIYDSKLTEEGVTAEEKTRLMDKAVQEVNTLESSIDTSFTFLLEGMGDLDDWLGLKRMLYMSSTSNIPFDENKKPVTQITDWYPKEIVEYLNLRNKMLSGDNTIDAEKVKSVEAEIDKKIAKINRQVKMYVLNDLINVSDCFSDETSMKLIALRATIEFNKEFSDSIGGKQLYPKYVEVSGLDNKFNFISSYLSSRDIFNSSTTGLSYVLAYKEGWPALSLGFMDIVLKCITYGIPILAILCTIVAPFLMLLAYFLRKNRWVRYMVVMLVAGYVLAGIRFLNILLYKLSQYTSTHMGILGTQLINIGISIAIIAISKLILKLIVSSLKHMTFESVSDISETIYNRIGRVTNYGRRRRYGDTQRRYSSYVDMESYDDYDPYANSIYRSGTRNQENYNMRRDNQYYGNPNRRGRVSARDFERDDW